MPDEEKRMCSGCGTSSPHADWCWLENKRLRKHYELALEEIAELTASDHILDARARAQIALEANDHA